MDYHFLFFKEKFNSNHSCAQDEKQQGSLEDHQYPEPVLRSSLSEINVLPLPSTVHVNAEGIPFNVKD